jgi:hypothetical protein
MTAAKARTRAKARDTGFDADGEIVPGEIERGKIGTGAPPPSPTEGWDIVGTVEYPSGTYFFLNIATGGQRERVTVKARMDGTYLCLSSSCLSKTRKLLHYADGPYGGCIHARFIRDRDYGAPAPHDVEPPPPTDTDHDDTEATHAGTAESTADGTVDTAAEVEPGDEPSEAGGHVPPF